MEEKIFRETEGGKILELNSGLKSMYLPSVDTKDPNLIALAEILFWTEGFEDHAKITHLLLPHEEENLAKYIESTKKYKDIFRELHNKARQIDPSNWKALEDLINETAEHAEMIAEELRELEEGQMSGELKTLMWTSFIDHLALEAEYFLDRKEKLLKKDLNLDREELIDFWSVIMIDHGNFIAHMLDPEEEDLVTTAVDLGEKFFNVYENRELNKEEPDPVINNINEIVDFKQMILKGIQAGQVSSILVPELADHMRKEALMFKYLLERADKNFGM